jgi:hypothetical protein
MFFCLDTKELKSQDSRRQSLLGVVTGSFRSAAFTFAGRLSVLLLQGEVKRNLIVFRNAN